MIRIQDIADMVGVSRTTVSNVIHGKTKKVSKEKITKINNILKEVNYRPNMGSFLLSSNSSKIIGVVIGQKEAHGYNYIQDPFINSFLSVLEVEVRKAGYYLMLIGGRNKENVLDVASRWSIDGLIILGFSEAENLEFQKKLNKSIVAVNTFISENSKVINVGIDDFSGGKQVGEYLATLGFKDALFLSEHDDFIDLERWLGFKSGMEEMGVECKKNRHIILLKRAELRLKQYEKLLPIMLKSKALFFSADFLAVEALNFFIDNKIKVPEEISIVGFDDNMFSTLVRPELTTVRQDMEKKVKIAYELLMRDINNEIIVERNIKLPVKLVIRNSVKKL